MDVTSARSAVEVWLRALAAPLAPAGAPERPEIPGDAPTPPRGTAPTSPLPHPAPRARAGADPAAAAPRPDDTATSAAEAEPARAAELPATPHTPAAPPTRAFPRLTGTTTPRGHALPGLDANAAALRATDAFATTTATAGPGRAPARPYLRPARDQELPPWPRTAAPDTTPFQRPWPESPGPVDVAAALAPLLAAPGTVPLTLPATEPATANAEPGEPGEPTNPASPAGPARPTARESAADLADLLAEALEEETRLLGVLELEP